jgi:hypothetical protein
MSFLLLSQSLKLDYAMSEPEKVSGVQGVFGIDIQDQWLLGR